MINPLNTGANKAVWTTAVLAAVNLFNGRLPADIALSGDEIGWLMTVIAGVAAYLIKNKD